MYKNTKHTLAVFPDDKILNISEFMYLTMYKNKVKILSRILYFRILFYSFSRTRHRENPTLSESWCIVAKNQSNQVHANCMLFSGFFVLSEYHILFLRCHITSRSPDLCAYFVKVAVCLHSGQCLCMRHLTDGGLQLLQSVGGSVMSLLAVLHVVLPLGGLQLNGHYHSCFCQPSHQLHG